MQSWSGVSRLAVAVITGCSTGIGYEMALALARAGYDLFATMRNTAAGAPLSRIAAEENLSLHVVTLDVDSDASVNEAFARIGSKQKQVDVLVNNAGIALTGPIEEAGMPAFRRSMETNFFGVLRCIEAVLPGMRERRSGWIVNVSSVSGRVSQPAEGPYVASKFALEGLSEVLAQEVRAFNIHVAILQPGVIDTPIFAKAGKLPAGSHYPHERRLRAQFRASLERATPAAEVGQRLVAILASDSWQLRHPVGQDARPLLTLRKMLSDEEWIERSSDEDDEAWLRRMRRDYGIDLAPYLAADTL